MRKAPFISVGVVRLFIDKLSGERIERPSPRVGIFSIFVAPVCLASFCDAHFRGVRYGVRDIDVESHSLWQTIVEHTLYNLMYEGEAGGEIRIRRMIREGESYRRDTEGATFERRTHSAGIDHID